MIKYAYDLYPRTNPVSGARIGRFSKLQGAEYRGEANGTGAGRAILRGTSSDGALIDPAGLQYIRVRRINTDIVDGTTLSGFQEAVVGGFFLDNGEFEALTERSTKKLTFGGAGALSYLGRAIAADEPYLTSIATSTRWKVANTGAPPAGWHTVGFDDSGYAFAVRAVDPGIGAGSRWVDGESRRWIWQNNAAADGEERSFRKEFYLPSVPLAPYLLVAADNGMEVRINGTLVATLGADGRGGHDMPPFAFQPDLTRIAISPSLLTTGTNCISIIGWNALTPPGAAPAGVYAALLDPDRPAPVEGVWEFVDETAGFVLWRMVSEALSPNRPQQPISGVTLTFTANLDSSGNAWPDSISIRFQVGEGLLSIIRRLMQAGLYVSMNPDTFALSAWPASAHGRVRTGAAWGANVVRFQAPTAATVATGNIKSDAKRGLAALVERSDLLVGSQSAHEWVRNAGVVPVWEGGYQVDNAAGSDLAAVGAAQLEARADAGDTVRLRQKLGNAETTGHYLPFEHVQLDDRVTLHTGTGQWDWNETEQKVAAITLKLRSAREWDAWVDLGSRYGSVEQRAFQVTPVGAHTHPPNPPLCPIEAGYISVDASWKVLNVKGVTPPAGWNLPAFDDSAWAYVGHHYPPGGNYAMDMITQDVTRFIKSDEQVYRKDFYIAEADLAGAAVVFKYALDNGGYIYVNGVQVASLLPLFTETASHYNTAHATTIARSNFVAGLNCIAIYVTNDAGGTNGGTPPGPTSGGVYIEMPTSTLHGTDNHASRCNHGHLHKDIQGRSAAGQHPASAVSETVDGDVQTALNSIRGRAWKQPVRAATTTAGTLASSFENGDTIDGVVLATGDRILIKDQAAGAENGIYVVNASGAPTRATDMDASGEVLGAAVLVTEGTVNADKVFRCTTNAPITLGTSALTFAEWGSGPPSGAAGGDLSGTYPNPSVVDDSHAHTGSTAPGGLGPLLLASDHAAPIVFDDILQASDGADFLYASEP